MPIPRHPNLSRRSALLAFTVAGLMACPLSAAEAGQDSLEMEVGGLFTVDGGNRFEDWENTPARLGVVELSAKVRLNPQMEGAITLMSVDDPENLFIDQAVGQWSLGPGQIVFGQQYFNLGLLTTHLISDPSILELAEFNQAGITGLWQQGVVTLGAGLTSLATGSEEEPSSDPCVVLNADVASGDQMFRLAGQVSKERIGGDAAANLALGSFALDAEVFWRFKDDDGVAKGGYYAGLAWTPKEGVEVAVRWDGLGDEAEALAHNRFAGGLTLTWLEHIFGSAEVGHDEMDGAIFAVQMGLRSDLKLPGFQRKTLVKE
jgi:hypothetical protein